MIKAVFFDMDGVLLDVAGYNERTQKVAISTWNALFDHLGIYQEHERLKAEFIRGAFPSYMEWTDEACRVLQRHGLNRKKFIELVDSRAIMRGAKETIGKLKEAGYKTAVITGSFSALAKRVRHELGIDFAVAHCELVFDRQGNLVEWKLIPCDYEGKIEYFKRLAEQMGVSPAECVYVGDEVNDIPIFKEVGLAIAFNCHKKEVRKAAHAVVDGKDLNLILPRVLSLTNR